MVVLCISFVIKKFTGSCVIIMRVIYVFFHVIGHILHFSLLLASIKVINVDFYDMFCALISLSLQHKISKFTCVCATALQNI